ncbi:phosphoribosylglycinamide formyltransferase [Bacteroidota bacterium]
MLNLAVFVSGRGSNFKAILETIKQNKIDARVSVVFSNKKECPALKLAFDNGIEYYSVANEKKEGYIIYDKCIEILEILGVGLIVLAGYLKKIPDRIISSYKNRVINIHPALLPSFGGKGMYGMNVHNAVYNKSCQISGVSVHFVDEIYDNGKIIAQRAVDISDVDSPEEIAERVLKIEHELLPYVVEKFSLNKVKIVGERVVVLK